MGGFNPSVTVSKNEIGLALHRGATSQNAQTNYDRCLNHLFPAPGNDDTAGVVALFTRAQTLAQTIAAVLGVNEYTPAVLGGVAHTVTGTILGGTVALGAALLYAYLAYAANPQN